MSDEMNREELASAMEERRREIEQEFRPENMKIVRKELFASLRDPAVTIRNGNITFNTACINGLEDVVWVNLMVDADAHMIAVHECDENDQQALRWCIAKPDKRKSRKMTCPKFTEMLYEIMGWDKGCRYKILGFRIERDGKTYYVFDLNVYKIFKEKPKVGQEEEASEPVDTRKGYYPADIANTFGVSLEEHKQTQEMAIGESFVPMAQLTEKSDV